MSPRNIEEEKEKVWQELQEALRTRLQAMPNMKLPTEQELVEIRKQAIAQMQKADDQNWLHDQQESIVKMLKDAATSNKDKITLTFPIGDHEDFDLRRIDLVREWLLDLDCYCHRTPDCFWITINLAFLPENNQKVVCEKTEDSKDLKDRPDCHDHNTNSGKPEDECKDNLSHRLQDLKIKPEEDKPSFVITPDELLILRKQALDQVNQLNAKSKEKWTHEDQAWLEKTQIEVMEQFKNFAQDANRDHCSASIFNSNAHRNEKLLEWMDSIGYHGCSLCKSNTDANKTYLFFYL